MYTGRSCTCVPLSGDVDHFHNVCERYGCGSEQTRVITVINVLLLLLLMLLCVCVLFCFCLFVCLFFVGGGFLFSFFFLVKLK